MISAALLIFAAVFLTVLALFLVITAVRQSPAAELKRRLRRMEQSGTGSSDAIMGNLLKETTPAEQFIFRLPLMGSIKRMIEHSGVTIRPVRFLIAIIIASTSVFAAMFALRGNLPAALLTAALAAVLPFGFLGYRRQQRQKRFDELLPDALLMIARSLRAGHSLSGAVELISQEMPEPVGGRFKIAFERQKLGMRIAEALGTLPAQIDSVDLQFFVTIIRINSETGGNLSEILEKLAETIRARLQIRRQVQVYTAEGRMSGYVLVLLPVFVFIAFYLRNPDYMGVFFTEKSCQMSLIAAGLAQVAGFLMIRKIIDIRI